jgi:hypothetical protein
MQPIKSGYRSGFLLFCAGVAGACHYGIVSLSWGWGFWWNDAGSVVCAFFGWMFSMVFFGQLGGNLLSTKLDEYGWLDVPMKTWAPFALFIVPTALIVLAYANPPALRIIDLLFAFGIVIRLLQWNGFEPDGLSAFEAAK